MTATRLPLVVLLLIGTLAMVGAAACQRHSENRVEAAGEQPSADRSMAMNPSDKTFIIDAEKADIQERYLGRLALERSNNDRVKEYARMLADDHNRALKNLVDLMQQKGMSQPTTLPEAREEALDRFKNMSGSAFDEKFVDLMIKDHEQAVNMFKHEASTAQDNDVRKYASDWLPTLEKHLQKALELKREGIG
jgi:putative membrane protein